MRTDQPDRYDAVLLQLRRYDDRLRRFGLRDRHLDWKVTTATRSGSPFARRRSRSCCCRCRAAGLLLFFVPYQLTAFIARRFTRERDVIATAQLFSGAAVYAAWFGALTFAAYALAGRTGAFIALVLLPLVALTSLRAIERESEVLASVRAWWLLRRARDETKTRLRRHRSELANVLDDVRAWLFDE